ncbi:DNA topoisomerase 3 [uncultured Thiodictyon sp.]|uniref:DNA topoisomerase 3 n=1 Tax=uncultured Thiodictyon sp. TaxID=1846217 RepID=UPI0025FEFBDE|nr:DNA topoisomerase 3 [uncultured Thiodictyon sp.]
MRLFIAEKPDLAKAIVAALGGGTRNDGHFECGGGDYVTWCFGHMLALYDPEDYDEKYEKWALEDLPFSHIPWKKKPGGDEGSKKQLKHILALLKQASTVVHAGDPDEEGQLLVDEILEFAHCALPVQRVLINDNNTALIRKAIANMRDNGEFAGLSAAAEARSVGDQLYGYNMTRCYTLIGQSMGYSGVLSVGRVQTPVLGLVVRRTRAFRTHTKALYFTITGQFAIEGLEFPARYQIEPADPVDEKGRLSDATHAEALAATVTGKPARVLTVETKHKEAHAPLPYNLLKLQTDASRKFGYKPDVVKDITQRLREQYKLITYNRSDCEYLSDEQHPDGPAVLAAISQTAPALAPLAKRADPTIKSRAFDSSKVSAHHGIIPTQATADLSTLPEPEQRIYLLIARAYIGQFWPKHLFDQTDVMVEVERHRFAVRCNVTTRPGWKTLYSNDVGNEDLEGNADDLVLDLRALNPGQVGQCVSAEAVKQETKPQPLYTIATLLSDLTRVAKYIRDDTLRKMLVEKDKGKEGEHGGIGTPATRDTIIATLFTRGYLVEQGKSIVPTAIADEFYDALPDAAKFPDMTALWHSQQKEIQSGERDTVSFVRELMTYIAREVESVKANGLSIKVDTQPCPTCGRPLRRIKKKDKEEFFWGCTGVADGCKYVCNDHEGKPVLRAALAVSATQKCQTCGAGLVRRDGRRGFWWSCSGYPECHQRYPDVKGAPDYARGKNEPPTTNVKGK